MILLKPFLENSIREAKRDDGIFRRNILKQHLQVLVLDFVYAHPKYSQLVFYGGSCLAHCFNLPRLSEDLDFVDLKKNVKISDLAKDLKGYFRKETDLELRILAQPSRVKLKFPILRELGVAGPSDSDLLMLKVEIFKGFDFCRGYKIEVLPLFKFNRSILIRSFDLPTMMATKMGAVLHRKWEKTDKEGKILATVKGRDYFDLMWYLSKDIKPNMKCIENIEDVDDLKKKILAIIGKLDQKSIQFDLAALIDDENFVKNLSKNIKNILKRETEQKL